jgi:Ion channel
MTETGLIPAAPELWKDIAEIDGMQLLLHRQKLFDLEKLGLSLKDSDQSQALLVLSLAAWKARTPPDSFDGMKEDYYRECSGLIAKLGGGDHFFDWQLALLFRGRNAHKEAGIHFERAAEALQRVNGIKVLSEKPENHTWGEAFSYLQDATLCYQQGGDSEAASRCFFKAMIFKRVNSSGLSKLVSWASCLVWGWGERPSRVVLSGAIVILLFAVGFWLSGIGPAGDLGNCMYLSVITFSTVGYGDLHPATPIGKVLAASEGLLGIFFTGLFLVTFVKKFSR